MGRHALSAELPKAIDEAFRARIARNDEGPDRLTEHVIRHADHGRLQQILAFEELRFNPLTAGSFASALQKVLLSSDDVDEAFVIDRREIASIETTCPEVCLGFWPVVPVALGNVVAFGGDLADLTREDVGVGVINDAQPHAWNALSNGTPLRVEILGSET